MAVGVESGNCRSKTVDDGNDLPQPQPAKAMFFKLLESVPEVLECPCQRHRFLHH